MVDITENVDLVAPAMSKLRQEENFAETLRKAELDDARVRAVAALAAKVQEQQAAALEAKAAKA